MGPRDRLKKASGFDFECSSNIQPRLKKSFLLIYTYVKDSMILYVFILYPPHSHVYLQWLKVLV